MRKRNIKTLFHWIIMTTILLVPFSMVLLSTWDKNEQQTTINYKYKSNEVESESDLIIGNIYNFSINDFHDFSDLNLNYTFTCVKLNYLFVENYSLEYNELIINSDLYCNNNYISLAFYDDDLDIFYNFNDDCYMCFSIELSIDTPLHFDFDFIYDNDDLLEFDIIDYISKSNYNEIESVSITNKSLRNEIITFANDFKNLGVNGWYSQMLTAIGFNMPINNIMLVLYMYPLYVIWVYVFDLIADLILVIVKIGHDALENMGVKNE